MTQADPRLTPLRDSLTGMVLKGSAGVGYYLRERIGEGGQGWVFRANWDDPAGHVVIVKVLRPDVVSSEALQRFKREAEVLRMLSTQGRPNPYVVRFYDHAIAQVPSPYGREPVGLPFTVLEFVDGTNLERVLQAQKGLGLSAERARRLLRQICQALDSVHTQKVVHRDLKPSNIMLSNEGGTEVAKVTDFGLVKLVDVNLQKTAALAGASLGYAPPEQYEQGNRRVSERTDVFSLAALVYEMLTGAPAFPFNDGENPFLVLTRILTGPRPSLLAPRGGRLTPEIAAQPALAETIDKEVQRALSADPDARHPRVLAFWDAIEPALRAAAQSVNAEVSFVPRSISAFDATVEEPSGAARAVPAGASAVPPEKPAVSEAVAREPAAWTWSRLTAPLTPGALRFAAFTSFDVAIGVSAAGLLRWERGAWIPAPLPREAAGATLRGIATARDGSWVLFGTGGFAARFFPDGRVEPVPVADPEIVFHAAYADDAGVTLVGERPYRGTAARDVQASTTGVVLQAAGGQLSLVADAPTTARLRGVGRVGGSIVACGERGALVRVGRTAVESLGTVCKGDLFVVAGLPTGGGVMVGSGGHALAIVEREGTVAATLEPVHTTRDLVALATSDDGQAWAGSLQARVLRRSFDANGAASWVRMDVDGLTSTSVMAISASMRAVRVLGDDGAVVAGVLA